MMDPRLHPRGVGHTTEATMTTSRQHPTPVLLQRAYDTPPTPGYRVLVDRFWPRGLTREWLALDTWARDLAPSAELVRWFHQDRTRWEAFRERYRAELATPTAKSALAALRAAAGTTPLVLVYGARDPEQNQAVVLREVVEGGARL